MYAFNIYAVPPFLTAVFLCALGLFVFTKNMRSEVNVSFLILCLSAALWQFGYGFVFLSSEAATAARWQKCVYVGVPLLSPALHHFSVAFLRLRRQRRLVPLFYCIAAFFIAVNFSSNVLISGVYHYFWGFYKKAGPLYTVFLLFWFIPGLAAVYNLYRSYLRVKAPLPRQRQRFMFIALAIVFVAIWDFIPAYGIEVYPFGYIGVISCVSVIAYALVRHGMMDVRVTITQTGIFIAVYTFVLGLPLLLALAGRRYSAGTTSALWGLGPLFLGTVLAIIGTYAYIYFQKRAEGLLLREQRRYQETLKAAGMGMTRIHSLDTLLQFIVATITENVHISHVALYLSEHGTKSMVLKAGNNSREAQPYEISCASRLLVWLQEHREMLIYEEVKRAFEESDDPLFRELDSQMRAFHAAVIVPCFLEDTLIGMMVLGEKLSGKRYTTEDLHVFSVLANHAALAIENARLYEHIEEQVRQRTSQLVEVQKQLIQAEKLATVGTLAGGVAHEINNPLTAVLTNVQMLLSSVQHMDVDTKESLELIEEATKRCRAIVQKLMAYAKKPLEATEITAVDLVKTMQNVVLFLSYQLEQESVALAMEEARGVYVVNGNANELEQLFTNLILNARDAIRTIRPGGAVHLSFSEGDNKIKVKIRDEGCGIPQEIIAKIFDPFFTTKDVGKGLGLGLSICQSIIEKHGGSITVDSEVGKGTLFTVTLPKVKVRSGA